MSQTFALRTTHRLSSTLTCDADTADFCSTITTLHNMLNEEINLPQIGDIEGSKQTIYIYSED